MPRDFKDMSREEVFQEIARLLEMGATVEDKQTGIVLTGKVVDLDTLLEAMSKTPYANICPAWGIPLYLARN